MNQTPSSLRVLLPMCAALVLSLFGDVTLYAVLPVQASAFGFSLGMVGVLLSANRLVRLGTNPLAGVLLDRWGRRPIFLAGLALGVVSTLIYVLTQHFVPFLLGRLLWGTAWSLINIGSYAILLDVTTVTNRGQGSGILRAFYAFGLGFNPLLGALLADGFGFRTSMGVCALLAVAGFLVALVTLPETMPPRATPPPRRARWRSAAEWRRRLGGLAYHRPLLVADYLYLLVEFVGSGIVMSTISLYVKAHYGETLAVGSLVLGAASVGGLLLALRAVATATAAPLAGRLSDRGDSRWTAVTWGVGLGIAGMVLLVTTPAPLGLAVAVGLVALSEGVVATILPALLGDLTPAGRRGVTLSSLMMAGDLGSALAPLVVYPLLSLIPLESAYLLAALGMATGLALPHWARKWQAQTQLAASE